MEFESESVPWLLATYGAKTIMAILSRVLIWFLWPFRSSCLIRFVEWSFGFALNHFIANRFKTTWIASNSLLIRRLLMASKWPPLLRHSTPAIKISSSAHRSFPFSTCSLVSPLSRWEVLRNFWGKLEQLEEKLKFGNSKENSRKKIWISSNFYLNDSTGIQFINLCFILSPSRQIDPPIELHRLTPSICIVIPRPTSQLKPPTSLTPIVSQNWTIKEPRRA